MDATPYIKNGRVLIPLRYMGYALGLSDSDVKWDNDNRQATLTRGQIWVRFMIRKSSGNPVKYSNPNDLAYLNSSQWMVNGFLGMPLDVNPEINNGRTMVPFRAASQALGGMCFWDPNERSVTLETWEKLPDPLPPMSQLRIYSVKVNRSTPVAEVTYANIDQRGKWIPGKTVQVNLDRPAYISDDKGWNIDAVQWFKAWGIPDSDMILDLQRGGLLVRGAYIKDGSSLMNTTGANFGYIYVGSVKGYDGLGNEIWYSVDTGADPAFIKNGELIAGWNAGLMPNYLWSKYYAFDVNTYRPESVYDKASQ
jgi:hypothetical protein